MAELSALRSLLRDRQVKEGALGTVEVSVVLDQALLTELTELESERDQAEIRGRIVGDPDSLAGAASKPADTSAEDAAVEAKKAEIEAATLTLVFKGVSSVKYQETMNLFEDVELSRDDFMNALAEACLFEAWSGEEKVAGPDVTDGIRWSEVYPQLSFGEWDNIVVRVFALNKRAVDAPFSRKPSKAHRQSAGTPKPA